MKNKALNITPESPDDYKAVEWLTFTAFLNFEADGVPKRDIPNEHYLAHIMRNRPAFIPELDFIGTVNGEIIASIMYTKSKVIRPDGSETATITFGPVSIKPELQRKGYGGVIIRHSLDAARKLGYGAVIILGHVDYYPRFGFKSASAYNLTMPDGNAFDAFMALELRQGYLGTTGGKWYEDEVFDIDETAFIKWNVEFQKDFL